MFTGLIDFLRAVRWINLIVALLILGSIVMFLVGEVLTAIYLTSLALSIDLFAVVSRDNE